MSTVIIGIIGLVIGATIGNIWWQHHKRLEANEIKMNRRLLNDIRNSKPVDDPFGESDE